MKHENIILVKTEKKISPLKWKYLFIIVLFLPVVIIVKKNNLETNKSLSQPSKGRDKQLIRVRWIYSVYCNKVHFKSAWETCLACHEDTTVNMPLVTNIKVTTMSRLCIIFLKTQHTSPDRTGRLKNGPWSLWTLYCNIASLQPALWSLQDRSFCCRWQLPTKWHLVELLPEHTKKSTYERASASSQEDSNAAGTGRDHLIQSKDRHSLTMRCDQSVPRLQPVLWLYIYASGWSQQ